MTRARFQPFNEDAYSCRFPSTCLPTTEMPNELTWRPSRYVVSNSRASHSLIRGQHAQELPFVPGRCITREGRSIVQGSPPPYPSIASAFSLALSEITRYEHENDDAASLALPARSPLGMRRMEKQLCIPCYLRFQVTPCPSSTPFRKRVTCYRHLTGSPFAALSIHGDLLILSIRLLYPGSHSGNWKVRRSPNLLLLPGNSVVLIVVSVPLPESSRQPHDASFPLDLKYSSSGRLTQIDEGKKKREKGKGGECTAARRFLLFQPTLQCLRCIFRDATMHCDPQKMSLRLFSDFAL